MHLACPECGDPLVPGNWCVTCGHCEECCGCDDDEFDADELGLDPEEGY